MSHVDDGKLNALLDGELDGAEADAVRAHVASCAECAARLEEAKRFLEGAADLLGALDLPATASAPPAAAPAPPPARRVSKTAREVAIDIDGATHKSPAIRPNVPEPAPARRPFDFTTLAWAAVIVLAIGVVYLANQVRRVRGGETLTESATQPTGAAAPVSSPAPAAPRTAHPAGGHSTSGTPASRRAATSHARSQPRPAGAAKAAAPAGGKLLIAAKSRALPSTRGVTRTAATELDAGAPPRVQAAPALANAAGPAGQVNAPAAPAPAPAPSARRASATADEALGGVARVALTTAATFRRATLEQAVARLDGVVRLIDGMRFQQVEIGPGSLIAGADRGRDVVRLIYAGAPGPRLTLDQQRITLPAGGGIVSADIGMRPGDTLTTATPQGAVRVRWISGTFWLSLTGSLPPDSLRRLTERVR